MTDTDVDLLTQNKYFKYDKYFEDDSKFSNYNKYFNHPHKPQVQQGLQLNNQPHSQGNFSQNNFFQSDTNDLATGFTKGKNALALPDITFKPGSQGSGSHYASGTTYTLSEVTVTADADKRPAIDQPPLTEKGKNEFKVADRPITDFYDKEEEQYNRLADLSEAVHDLAYGQKGLGTFNPFGQFMNSIGNTIQSTNVAQKSFKEGDPVTGSIKTLQALTEMPFHLAMMTNPAGFAWQQGGEIANHILPENTTKWQAPITAATDPQTDTGKAAAQIADIVLQLGLAHYGSKIIHGISGGEDAAAVKEVVQKTYAHFRELGYTDKQISEMAPQKAAKIVIKHIKETKGANQLLDLNKADKNALSKLHVKSPEPAGILKVGSKGVGLEKLTDLPGTEAAVPATITGKMQKDLKVRGFTDEQIKKMKSQEANDILSKPKEVAGKNLTYEELKPEEQKKLVSDFVDNVFSEENKRDNKQIKLGLWKVNAEQAETLEKGTGYVLKDYIHRLDKYDLFHIMKVHGNAKTEESRGQIAITKDDLKLIPDIIKNYDHVEDAGKNNEGNDVIKYTKRVNGNIIYFEEIRTGKKELVPKTMYKKKSGNETMPKPSLRTSETILPQGNITKNDIKNQQDYSKQNENMQKEVEQKTNKINVSRNKENGSIEITFSQTPSDQTIKRIKAQGFRWNEKNEVWLTAYTEKRWKFANDFAGEWEIRMDNQGAKDNTPDDKKSTGTRIPGRTRRKS